MSGRWTIARLLSVLAICVSLWAVVAAACLTVGSTGTIGRPTAEQFHYRIIVVLTASLIGAALASAGVAYQSVLRNPLADPYLLGASSGAALAAYLWRLPASAGWRIFQGDLATSFGQQGFAFAGALGAMAVVFAIAQRRGRLEPVTLLLVGVIVNAVNGSIILLVDQIFKNLPQGSGALTFLIGAIQTNLTMMQIASAALLTLAGFIVLMYVSGQLNVGALSDDEAAAMGVRVQRLRWIALIAASLMTAAVVSISGPIGFVGLICPHVAQLIVGRDVRWTLPASMSLGAMLLAIADAASRTGSGLGTQLPVGVLTGLLGGPFFLLLLLRRGRA